MYFSIRKILFPFNHLTGWLIAIIITLISGIGFCDDFVRTLGPGSFGNLFGILYSLAGGILSLAVMALLKRSGAFSIIGVSMAGGVSHNVGQLIMAMLVVETYAVGYYLPVLLIAGLITGTLIGIAGREMLKRLDLAVLN